VPRPFRGERALSLVHGANPDLRDHGSAPGVHRVEAPAGLPLSGEAGKAASPALRAQLGRSASASRVAPRSPPPPLLRPPGRVASARARATGTGLSSPPRAERLRPPLRQAQSRSP